MLAYHDRTKHAFQRFAPALGYLDWATQPDPFRRYRGAPLVELPRAVPAYTGGVAPFHLPVIGDLLRCAFGLTAWKQAGASRWALRANPSSGNLHPIEAYVVTAAPDRPAWCVSHYAPKEHALETRAVLEAPTPGLPDGVCLVGFSSIHWREAWKYGERAFRYCQHDVGHAIGALAYSAARLGWRVRLLSGWSDADIAMLLGLPDTSAGGGAGAGQDDLPQDALADGPEPEQPDCLLAVGPGDVDTGFDVDGWVAAARRASWVGQPNQLSPSRVEWPAIDAVAAATRRTERGPHADVTGSAFVTSGRPSAPSGTGARPAPDATGSSGTAGAELPVAAAVSREWLIRRRSAVSFDGRGALSRTAFARMVARVQPGGGGVAGLEPSPVWSIDAAPPQVRLIWFVHRVEGLASGIYGQPREPGALSGLRDGLRDDLLWEPVPDIGGLYLLAPLDARGLARRLSCDQDIAADGYVGMAMLAPLAPALHAHGAWFYRRLFWECGLIGQVLYLEAEIAGGRATGIGCYYDDPVHDVLGIRDHRLQSLYHFSMGVPVEDGRLTT
ncbi:MAG: nitroreductase family protein, partial [Vicinamibacterales bacterium]